MANFQDAFISYGRADSKAFAKQLNDRLVAEQLEVWFDFDDIPLGVDYQNQIDAGIEQADNFIYIIAPHSVNSPYCGKEIELALRCHKRIIPILHVEQITQETWQQRNPQGTDEQWEAYKTKGAHSSFPNMHPEVAKINWIYCREGLDDFDSAFQGLLAIQNRQKPYVHEHTVLLNQALDWERQQKQSRYLLVGEARQKAEAWLKVRFKDEQAPCVPSPLHCEFITESIKNGHNLMTQVFLSYAGEEIAIMEQVRQSLRRESLTVWTNKTDIQTGMDFQDAINRGIEEADNIVYLMSPAALASSYCQQEIDYALKLNKRIIPLLVKPTDLDQIPPILRNLQYIDLTDNVAAGDYAQDESELLRILRQDAAYYEEHKMLLSKALKWERQQRNPSILLRGYNMQHAESWLKVGKQRSLQPPLPIHEDFIAASLQQPPGLSLDVFVSYSRADSDFGRRLNDALQAQGKTTWFDQESIASGSDFQREIYRGIENSNNFLFVISPNSISSPYCADEVEYAQKLNKRVVTILHRPVDPADLHPVLAAVQWIDFNQREGEFSANFKELLRTIDTDPVHLQTHTRLLVRAIEWESKGRKDSFLLRGDDLEDAEEWIAASASRDPKPTALQQDYVKSSRSLESANQQASQILEAAAAKGRQRVMIGTVVMVIGFVVAGIAGVFAHKAEEKAAVAETQTQVADLEKQGSQVLKQVELEPLGALVSAVKSGKTLKEMVPADRSLPQYPATSPLLALQTTLTQIREQTQFPHAEGVTDVDFSPDGKLIVTASNDKTARLWDISGKAIRELKGHPDKVTSARFSPDGKRILTASDDGTARLWDVQGKQLAVLKGDKGKIGRAWFSTDGQRILTDSDDDTARQWNLSGKQIAKLKVEGFVREVSPDGKSILTSSSAPSSFGKTVLSDWSGKQTAQLNVKEPIFSAAFSPNGQRLVTTSFDKIALLWDASGKQIAQLIGHRDPVLGSEFSPDGQHILTASLGRTARLWDLSGKQTAQLNHDGPVSSASFSPNGQRVVTTTSSDKTVRLWDLSGKLITELKGHQDGVNTVKFSPDGKQVVTASEDRTARLWNLADKAERTMRVWNVSEKAQAQQKDAPNQLRLSTRSQYVLAVVNTVPPPSGTEQNSVTSSVQLWNRLGTLKIPLNVVTPSKVKTEDVIYAETRVRTVVFSFDEKYVATLSGDRTIQVWKDSGQRIAQFKPSVMKYRSIPTISLSPDGQSIAAVEYGDDGDIARIWNRTGQKLLELKGHQGQITSISFSPDGKYIVTAATDQTARVWNLSSGKQLAQLKGHRGSVLSARFSADSQYIVTAAGDNTARLWDISGQLISELKGHQSDVTHANFSPDGQHIITTSQDETAKVWDRSGRVIAEFHVRDEKFTDAVFSADGQQIITASSTGQVQTWRFETLDQLMTHGCSWLSNYLKNTPGLLDSDRQICDSILTAVPEKP